MFENHFSKKDGMKLKGVCYDAGSVMWFNWRPEFDPRTVAREIEIIKKDLHCNAIRITGLDINRLLVATEIALKQGLEVWLSPTMWDKKQDQTLAYVESVAESAEKLRREYPESLVLVVGGELTLFMSGVVEGRNVTQRMTNLMKKFRGEKQTIEQADASHAISRLKASDHNRILGDFLAKASNSVRRAFGGKIAYASLMWESVDWNLFDYVGVDAYRNEKIKDQYVDMLKPAFESGKPVVVTEFGVQTYEGAEINGAGLGGNIIDYKSQGFHYSLPLIGRLIRPKLIKGKHVRDEELQARELLDQLSILDKAGVYGAFVSGFVSQINPYDDDPRYDLDMASMSLVKSYSKGKHGATYPDMKWEPKESFRVVADYYGRQR
jgi:hypothetical protein